MRRLILLVLVSFFYSASAWAACDGELYSYSGSGKFTCSAGDSAIITSDMTINSTSNETIRPADNVTITNYGNITNSLNYLMDTEYDDNLTINNKSTGYMRTTKSRVIFLDKNNTVDINNEGEIYAYTYCAICGSGARGPITITNSGTIHTGTTNWSTGVTTFKSAIGMHSPDTGESYDASFTINNSGTIKSVDDNLAGI
ncbi:uncharacterized protein METZ01_LOCUS517810, partial [marine metagenome]